MNRSDILLGIEAVANDCLDFEGTLSEDSALASVLELDSVRLLTLVVELEDHFQVCLEEGDEQGLETVGDLAGLLQLRLREQCSTLAQLLADIGATSRGGLRFLDRRERPTWVPWSEVHERGSMVGASLARLGLQSGDRVALLYPTCPEFFDAFFGVMLAGGVPVPLYPPVRLGRMEEYHRRTATMMEAASVRLVLADPKVRRVLGKTVELAKPELGCLSLDRLPPSEGPVQAAVPHELALVQFSSGTTVDPKPVALSHRALLYQGKVISDALREAHPEIGEFHHRGGVSWLPLYHDMGLIGCLLPAMLHDRELTLIGPELFVARPALWLRAISRYGASISPAPNFAYSLCVERIRDQDMEGVDLSCWKAALNGAEPVAASTLRRFVERFATWGLDPRALTPVYGLSEAALAVTFSDIASPFATARFCREALAERGRAVPDEEGVEMVSVGQPLPGTELRVVDPEGRSVEEGQTGHIRVRCPSLMEGYLDRPRETARVLREGWLDTGDLGFVHGGELFISGRAKDLVILRGRNHSPSELELSVEGVSGLRAGCTAAVSWRPEGAESETLALFVEHSRSATQAQRDGLAKACAEALRDVAGLSPDLVVVLEPGTLPRTSSGKIRRGDALRRFLDGELRPPARSGMIHLGGILLQSQVAFARRAVRG
jgi:acyl-CoA synthetase (AMP-forming)/AMP-acid ligase II